MTSVFHLAINVTDLDEARAFYGDLLGCAQGRSTETWVDFDFFGHQLSLHLGEPLPSADTGQVAGRKVPMPHFGAILAYDDWRALADRLQAAGTDWVLEPGVRFRGRPGEQWTMFLRDPFGNALEFKGVRSRAGIFAR